MKSHRADNVSLIFNIRRCVRLQDNTQEKEIFKKKYLSKYYSKLCIVCVYEYFYLLFMIIDLPEYLFSK